MTYLSLLLMTSLGHLDRHRYDMACVQRRKNFWSRFLTECTGQRNDFELIPTVKVETIQPIEGYFGKEFHLSVIVRRYGGLKWQVVEKKIFVLHFWNNDPLRKIFTILFRKDSSSH